MESHPFPSPLVLGGAVHSVTALSAGPSHVQQRSVSLPSLGWVTLAGLLEHHSLLCPVLRCSWAHPWTGISGSPALSGHHRGQWPSWPGAPRPSGTACCSSEPAPSLLWPSESSLGVQGIVASGGLSLPVASAAGGSRRSRGGAGTRNHPNSKHSPYVIWTQ